MSLTKITALCALVLLGSTQARGEEAPRGLASLAALQPGFKDRSLQSMADILRAAENPELAFLFTTFGTKYENAAEIVKPLIAEGRSPRVAVYLLNGPGRRNESRRPYIDFQPKLKPPEFKAKLRDMKDAAFVADLDKKIMAPARAFVDAMNQYADGLKKPRAKFIMIPELEDNFEANDADTKAIKNLVVRMKAAFAGVANVSYRRNPLGERAPLDRFRLAGMPIETHSYRIATLDKLKRGDTLTGDGAHFLYSTESGAHGAPFPVQEPVAKFADVKALLARAKAKGVGVLLWRGEWQGISETSNTGDPKKRFYVFPQIGTYQWDDLRELLHEGVKGALPAPLTKIPTKPASTTKVVAKGTKVDGADGFLWKPVSDSDGRLVVLAPKDLTGRVVSMTVRTSAGAKLETSSYRGVGNGDREHHRFKKAGRDYPADCVAQFLLADGTARDYPIKAPSQRYD